MLQGSAAFGVLMALIVGPPVMLAVVAGNPLPQALPSAAQIGDALARPVDDTLLLGTLRAIAWLLWMAFTASTVLEAAGRLRGRRAPRLPGIGGLQHLAGQLITSIMLVKTPATALAAAVPAPITAALSGTVAADLAADPAADPAPATFPLIQPAAAGTPAHLDAAVARGQAETSPPTYKVQRGDNLWEIAERELGDGRRWQQIAALNPDRITDPQMIRPGWSLRLPTPAPPSDPPSDPPRSEPRPSSPPPAEEPRPGTPTAPTLPGSSAAPSTAGPLSSPPSPATAPAPAPSHDLLTGTAEETPGSASDEEAELTDPDAAGGQEPDSDVVGRYAAVFAGGLLAGGVLTRLAQMRQRQRQHRRPGRRITLPAAARPHRTEQRLARQADRDAGPLLRHTLSRFRAALRRDNRPVPAVVGVHLTGARVEILLAHPVPDAPAPFTVLPGSRDMCWQLPLTTAREEGRRQQLRSQADPPHGAAGDDPLPGLLAIGRTSPGGYLLVDVERLGLVGCTRQPSTPGQDGLGHDRIDQVGQAARAASPGLNSDPGLNTDVDAVLRTLAIQAATNPWQGWYDAILVGFHELETLEGVEGSRVQVCDDLEEAIDLLAWRSRALHAHLKGAGAPEADVRQRRLLTTSDADGEAGEELVLTLLISRHQPDTTQLRRLTQLTSGNEGGTGGIAAVVPVDPATPMPTRFVLHYVPPDETPTGGPGSTPVTEHASQLRLRIEPLQLTVQPLPLASDDYHDIAALLTCAADLNDQPATTPPYASQAGAVVPDPASGGPPTPAQQIGHRDQPPHADHQARRSTAEATAPPPASQPPPLDLSGVDQPRPQDDVAAGAPPPAAGDGVHVPAPGTISAAPGGVQPVPVPGAARPSGAAEDAQPEPDTGVQVQLLGPVRVQGAVRALQPRQLELVVMLALAPDGLRGEQIRARLGGDPDRPQGNDTFRQLVTRTRRRLGTAADDRARIEHRGKSNYRLHDVAVDWHQFRDLIAQSAGLGDDAVVPLRQALRLVRGRPLEDCSHWWLELATVETMRASITDAAELLAELELAAGDPGAPARAVDAARTGLLADPLAEQLWRMLMRAEHAAGNISGVQEAWAGCLRELADIDDDLRPSQETATLYRRLTGQIPAPSRRAHP